MVGDQSVYPTRHGVSAITGLPLENVRVIFVRGAGCYGLNAADTVSYDAALLSQAVRKPVRVQLTRQDEFISEKLRCSLRDRATGWNRYERSDYSVEL